MSVMGERLAVCRLSGAGSRATFASLVSGIETPKTGMPYAGRASIGMPDTEASDIETSGAEASGIETSGIETSDAGVPGVGGSFLSITRTADEISIVCAEGDEPEGAKVESGWRAFEVLGPLEFSMTGVLAAISVPLAEAGVPIFVVSTFGTDYFLVKEEGLARAISALEGVGHEVSSDGIFVRPVSEGDGGFMWKMLAEAAHEKDVRAVAESPELAVYLDGWGREGDIGFVAEHGGLRVGAAWVRLLGGSGYGFVDDETPELAIAASPEFRGRGVGGRLLARLMDEVRGAYPSISLSVREGNPARRLYERMGFEPVEGGEAVNRVGGGSATMKAELRNGNKISNIREGK